MSKTTILPLNHTLPDFSLLDQDGKTVTAKDLKGKWIVLYLYPRDLTPGCTTEAQDFSRLLPQFLEKGATVLGCSTDSVERHCKFMEKADLKIRLLSDPEHTLIAALGAWQLKKCMGKESMGIVRSTWLFNPRAKVAAVWSPVKVAGHAQEVLETLAQAVL